MLTYHSKHQTNRVTVVGEYNGDTLCLSAARCGKKDNFCRKTGRLIATGRFNKKKCISTVQSVEPTTTNFIKYATVLAEVIHKDTSALKQ